MLTPESRRATVASALADPTASAAEIRDRLLKSAKPLGLGADDVGTGLVQAPT